MRAIVGSLNFRRSTVRRLLRPFVLFLALSAMSCPEGEDVLRAYGYQTLIPPSNLMSVGTIVAVEDDEKNEEAASKYKIVCGPRAGWGAFFQPLTNRTMAQTLKRNTKSSFAITAALFDHVKAGAYGDNVKSVSATLQDARILSLSDADVLEGLPFRSEQCKLAIQQRLEQGFELTVVSQALLADMTYEIEWKNEAKLDKKARLKEMQHVAASLGAGYQKLSTKTIESRGLALGIKTDAFLLALSVPELNKCDKSLMRQVERERGPAQGPMQVDSSPDAPLVLPGNAGYILPEFVAE